MAKQIKLGFDKIPVPFTQSYEQLYDINTGVPLRDADGNPLYTEELSSVKEYGNTQTSTSIHVNNQLLTSGAVPVIEQFPEQSQVSSSLLGVPRAEVQLSLFSDVSTYGLDENIWEYFSIGSLGYQPTEWVTRRNKTYGNRFYQRLEEIPNEQALAIVGYPTPWSYPFGPNWKDVFGLYNETLFKEYVGFITLGNWFYDYYKDRNREAFAKANFLSKEYAMATPDGKDVEYFVNGDVTIEKIFEEIEQWTITWMKLRDGELVDDTGAKVTFPSEGALPPGYNASNTSPGYYSNGNYAQLESKRTYRYQPGRISGFTYGIRSSTDPASLSNIIEWGCGNDTDEYVFQLKGSQFNIVRRSVIPLPVSNLVHMKLTESDQKIVKSLNPLRSSAYKQESGDFTGDDTLYETVIPRDKFNGDPLNGNGASGYIVNFENVTMWKIEFSWYGAIGAKFYVYIPVGNNGARWVLIHTLIIENELNRPCLKDPFFKFRYMMVMQDTSNLRTPQYIYKYGASYYIDGGDEGTTTIHSYPSNPVTITSNNTRSVLGIWPKNYIYNSDGIGNPNRKDVIPQKMSITSSVAAQINVIDCEGCPGFGHHYAPSLSNGVSGVTGNFVISPGGDYLVPDELSGVVNNSGTISTVTIDAPQTTNGLSVNMPVNRLAGTGNFGPGAYISAINANTNTITVETLVRVNGSISGTTLTTSGLTQAYVGASITGTGVLANTTISSVVNATTAVVSVNHTSPVNNVLLSIKTLNTAGALSFTTVPADWKPTSGYKKIIGNGLYSSYIDSEGKIFRRTGSSTRNNEITNGNYNNTKTVVKYDGTKFDRIDSAGNPAVFQNVRLTGYNAIAASTVPLTKNKMRINFLNPIPTDEGHFAEFIFGVTKKLPSLQSQTVNGEVQQKLVFGGQPLDLEKDVLYAEWAQYSMYKDLDGFDTGESEPRIGYVFEVDYRIPSPAGYDSGRCSQIRIDVEEEGFQATYAVRSELPSTVIAEVDNDDKTAGAQHFLVFTSNALSAVAGVEGGEIGILDANGRFYGSNVFFLGATLIQYQDNQTIKWCIPIAPPTGVTLDVTNLFKDIDQISLKTLTLSSRYIFKSKVFNYDVFPLYVIAGLRDNARINNITLEEEDEIGKFSHTPNWLKDSTSSITVVNSGKPARVETRSGTIVASAASTRITGLSSTRNLRYGMTLAKIGVSAGAFGSLPFITGVVSDTEITISASSNNTAGAITFTATDVDAEDYNPSTGYFESGGKSFEGLPPTNFIDNYRLDAGQVDTQLQQPLRPGSVRSTFYIGENETTEVELTHIYGPDRYTLTPGLKNTTATFITGKAIKENSSGEVQINLITKEQ